VLAVDDRGRVEIKPGIADSIMTTAGLIASIIELANEITTANATRIA